MQALNVYPKLDLAIKSSRGMWLETEAGQKVLDFYSGHGVISIGHSHPRWVERLTSQLQSFAYYSNLVPLKEQDELCRALGELSSCPDYNIFFSNSGAEAIENALKTASTVNGRKQVVAMRGSFHGRTSLAAQITDASKLCAPINSGLDVVWVSLDDIEGARAAIGEQTAAVILEGIQGVGGIWEGSTPFWQELSALCQASGALLIADEIQSGMGRTGDFFAFQKHGLSVKPDIICTAKGLGNGFPIAATWIHERFVMPMGSLGSTFGGGPLACRSALAVCEVIAAEKLMMNAAAQGEYLIKGLEAIPGIKNVRGRGLMLAFDIDGSCEALRLKLLHDYGLITGNASIKSSVRLLPPLTVTRDDCDFLFAQLKSALKDLDIK